MNAVSDTLLNRAEENKIETVRQEPKPVSDAELVELGKVSDTKGGWLGSKLDTGAGFQPY
jgi:hypothetical protein